MAGLGRLVKLTKKIKKALLLRVGPGAAKVLRQYITSKDAREWWRIEGPDGPALKPAVRSVVYLGMHLTLGDSLLPITRHRLAEAKERNAKIHRAVRSRRMFSLPYRVRTWRACTVSNATFGLAPTGMSYTAATFLRR